MSDDGIPRSDTVNLTDVMLDFVRGLQCLIDGKSAISKVGSSIHIAKGPADGMPKLLKDVTSIMIVWISCINVNIRIIL